MRDWIENNRILEKMDAVIDEVFRMFDNEPLEEEYTADIAELFKIKLNHRMGNLTDLEAEQGIRNISRDDGLLECVLTREYGGDSYEGGYEIELTALYNPSEEMVDVLETPENVSLLTEAGDAAVEDSYIVVVLRGESVTRQVCTRCLTHIVEYVDDHEWKCSNCD